MYNVGFVHVLCTGLHDVHAYIIILMPLSHFNSFLLISLCFIKYECECDANIEVMDIHMNFVILVRFHIILCIYLM